jgi:hypothetical protein
MMNKFDEIKTGLTILKSRAKVRQDTPDVMRIGYLINQVEEMHFRISEAYAFSKSHNDFGERVEAILKLDESEN